MDLYLGKMHVTEYGNGFDHITFSKCLKKPLVSSHVLNLSAHTGSVREIVPLKRGSSFLKHVLLTYKVNLHNNKDQVMKQTLNTC